MSAVRTTTTSKADMIVPEARYKWVIDLDCRATTGAKSMAGNMAGVSGPKGMCGLPIALPDSFRIVDGDSQTLYEGRTNALTLSMQPGRIVGAGEPLRDVGRHRGAAHIEYLIKGEWRRIGGKSEA